VQRVEEFKEHGENVNSVSYCEILLKLRNAIRRKRPGQPARGVLLHHDIARPHTAPVTQERIQELQWELLEHPLYSPDLTSSDFNLFGPLKTILVANVSLMTTRLNGGLRHGDNNQNSMLRVSTHL
jgi:hypothetical protein